MTDISEIRELTGLPVENFYKRRGSSPLSDRVRGVELGPKLKELANDPNVVAFGWTQYTPYFNDGDVCEFGVNDMWVQTTLDDEDKDRYELTTGQWHPTLSDVQYVGGERVPSSNGYGYTYNPGRWEAKINPFPETAKLAEEVAGMIQGAEITLLGWFGDHAEIRITKAGIQVDEYDHD